MEQPGDVSNTGTAANPSVRSGRKRDESSASLRTGHPSPGCLENGALPL